MTGRKKPPYSKNLVAQLSGDLRQLWGCAPDGQSVPLWVVAGHDAWYWAELYRVNRALILMPYPEDPAGYDWRIVKGHKLLLHVEGLMPDSQRQRLIVELVQAGALSVMDMGRRHWFVPEARAA